MPKNNYHIKAVKAPIIHVSSSKQSFSPRLIPVVKRSNYLVKPERVSGDAPKDLIYVYEYGRCRKINHRKWIPYIAKVGHKWYPSESITEHLLTRLGQVWGFNMANSKLYNVAGQIRFCSELFRKPEQELVHGADILARFLQEGNADIIEQIDRKGWSQEMLSFTFVKDAIIDVFPKQSKTIICELVKMLLFDAIVGNNDRHFFNWGVLRDLKGRYEPRFSPIYDTARGLFWNHPEENLLPLYRDTKLLERRIVKYHNETKPKIGWEKEKAINHCQMVERLLVNNDCTFEMALQLFSKENLIKAEQLLNNEFNGLISDIRKTIILRFLSYRFEEFNKLITS